MMFRRAKWDNVQQDRSYRGDLASDLSMFDTTVNTEKVKPVKAHKLALIDPAILVGSERNCVQFASDPQDESERGFGLVSG